jgi:hypothetical protein
VVNKKQLTLAARLYELANTALLDEGGCETDEERAVVALAIERTRAKLERMGYSPYSMNTLSACIDAAKRDAAPTGKGALPQGAS